jgi:uncharacterized membrane protein
MEARKGGLVKPVLDFVKTTVVGGLLFILPLGLGLFLIGRAVRWLRKVLEPLTGALTENTFLGVAGADLVALAALVAVAFLAGLLARTAMGRKLSSGVESLILRRMPGFTLLKGIAAGPAVQDSGAGVGVALARIDDAWLLSFVLETHASGLLTVLVPQAPTPASGNVYYMTENQIKRLDVSVKDAMKCIMQLGVGSRALLERAP